MQCELLKIEKICLQLTKAVCFGSLTSPHLLFCYCNGSWEDESLLRYRQLFAPSEKATDYTSKLTEAGIIFVFPSMFLFFKISLGKLFDWIEFHKASRHEIQWERNANKTENLEVLSHNLGPHIDVAAF